MPPLRTRFLIGVLVAAAALGRSGAVAADSPSDHVVVVVVHVPMTIPTALPGAKGEWYCKRNAALAGAAPIDDERLREYDRRLEGYGKVSDHFGFSSRSASARDTSVRLQSDDHIFVTTSALTAARFLPAFLRRMRVELHEPQAVGEIVGDAIGLPGRARVHVNVAIAFEDASYERLRRVHQIFGDGGKGGATQYDDAKGVHVYAGVPFEDATRIENELNAEQFAFTLSHESFVEDDAPRC